MKGNFSTGANTWLDRIESKIISTVREFPSDSVLLSVNGAIKEKENSTSQIHRTFEANQGGFRESVGACISSFAVRLSNPDRHDNKPFTLSDLVRLYQLVQDYLLADPVANDKGLREEFFRSNPVFLMLRLVASQFPFEENIFGFPGRTLLLFDELPKEVRHKFNFSDSFHKLTGLSVCDFVMTNFAAWSFASAKDGFGFTRERFDQARRHGLKLPDDEGVCRALKCVAASPSQFREKYDEMKQRDRRFRMYDFNPLFTFPIIRPWKFYPSKSMALDRLVSPIPNLICYRASTGIFYEMFNCFGEDFSEYFGRLLELYVGRLLIASVGAGNVTSEESIRVSYKGKAPDWVVVDGTNVILVEAKATRLSLAAVSTGAEQSVDDSLKQVCKGLNQLYEFRQAVIKKSRGLEPFHHCTEIKPLLITLEPFYLINSALFRDHVNEKMQAIYGTVDLPWRILSMKELECLQPHLAGGLSFAEVLSSIEEKTYNNVLRDLVAKTGLTFKDSFLSRYASEMFERMEGVEILKNRDVPPIG